MKSDGAYGLGERGEHEGTASIYMNVVNLALDPRLHPLSNHIQLAVSFPHLPFPVRHVRTQPSRSVLEPTESLGSMERSRTATASIDRGLSYAKGVRRRVWAIQTRTQVNPKVNTGMPGSWQPTFELPHSAALTW